MPTLVVFPCRRTVDYQFDYCQKINLIWHFQPERFTWPTHQTSTWPTSTKFRPLLRFHSISRPKVQKWIHSQSISLNCVCSFHWTILLCIQFAADRSMACWCLCSLRQKFINERTMSACLHFCIVCCCCFETVSVASTWQGLYEKKTTASLNLYCFVIS